MLRRDGADRGRRPRRADGVARSAARRDRGAVRRSRGRRPRRPPRQRPRPRPRAAQEHGQDGRQRRPRGRRIQRVDAALVAHVRRTGQRSLLPEPGAGARPRARCVLGRLRAGASLYQLATGSAPFEAANAGEVANAHLKTHVVPPRSLNRDVPLALEGVILRALAKDPGRRFSSAEEMRQALAEHPAACAARRSRGALTGVPAGARLRRPRLVETERKAWWRRNAVWPALLDRPRGPARHRRRGMGDRARWSAAPWCPTCAA